MKRFLSEQERQEVDIRVAEAEKKTGAQIVCAVVERCDAYAELPWKAFALGASMAGLAIVLLGLMRPGWTAPSDPLPAVMTTLAGGASLALLSIWTPGFGRLLLDGHRVEAEVRQYAESLFLTRELFATRGRTGVLLLVSLFERRVVVLPDTGLASCLSRDNLHKVITGMSGPLASGQVSRALEGGLGALEQDLSASSTDRSRANEIPTTIIEEKGQ